MGTHFEVPIAGSQHGPVCEVPCDSGRRGSDARSVLLGSSSVLALALGALLVISRPEVAAAQACPSPYVLVDLECTVPSGTIVTVTTTGGSGISDSGGAGDITADGITINLQAGSATGARIATGADITVSNSTIKTTSTATAAISGQTGAIVTGVGSLARVTDSSITLGNGTTSANNLTAIRVVDGGFVALTTSTIQMLGGNSGTVSYFNHGLVASGADSRIEMAGGSVTTTSRASFGVRAENGGTISLSQGATIGTTNTTSGAVGVPPNTSSYALTATGTGSSIVGRDIVVTTAGAFANAARAESGAMIDLATSRLSTSAANAHALFATARTPGSSVSRSRSARLTRRPAQLAARPARR